MKKARPEAGGTWLKNCSSASRPPADAPMPTMGKAVVAVSGVSGLSGEGDDAIAGALAARFTAPRFCARGDE